MTVGLKFLKSKSEYEKATRQIVDQGLVPHYQQVKNWDLVNIIPELQDGNILDMGSTDSYILHNAVRMGLKGKKYGVDLRPSSTSAPEVEYMVGDITDKMPFEDGFFDFVTCLSVIEHGVDVKKWSSETAKITRQGGLLFVTFDYWTPKISERTLGGLKWDILDDSDVLRMKNSVLDNGFILDGEEDWLSPVPVIDVTNGTPEAFPDVKFTFGFARFRRQ